MMEALRSFETLVLEELHGATSQKTVFFIVAAVKTSNLSFSTIAINSFSSGIRLCGCYWLRSPHDAILRPDKRLDVTLTLYQYLINSQPRHGDGGSGGIARHS
jgi:hypothetical protein